MKGTEKYIYFFGDRPDEVYDLSSDPSESKNLASERGNEELKVRRTELLVWFSKVNAMYEQRESQE